MLYREIIAVCSVIRTKHINTLCGENVELLDVKRGGTYSDHWAVKECSAIFYGTSATWMCCAGSLPIVDSKSLIFQGTFILC